MRPDGIAAVHENPQALPTLHSLEQARALRSAIRAGSWDTFFLRPVPLVKKLLDAVVWRGELRGHGPLVRSISVSRGVDILFKMPAYLTQILPYLLWRMVTMLIL